MLTKMFQAGFFYFPLYNYKPQINEKKYITEIFFKVF